MRSEAIHLGGNVTITVREGDRVVSSQTVHNLVVTGGRNLLRDLLRGSYEGNPALRHIAVGTSNTAPAAGQSALVAEVYRQVIIGMSVTEGSLNVQGYLGTSEANGETLKEAALFNVEGLMVARALFEAEVVKTESLTVSLSWDLNISAA